jgi:hypothetical protein
MKPAAFVYFDPTSVGQASSSRSSCGIGSWAASVR